MLDIEKVLNSYIYTGLELCDDEDEVPYCRNYDIRHIAPESLNKFRETCRKFCEDNAKDLVPENFIGRISDSFESRIGYLLWCNQNHHGVGFWDGDWIDEVGQRLSAAAHKFGEVYLFDQDGQIYGE